ncbi:inositol 2-dehydrogenase [Acidocella aquatica]|uniref:Inositol 2-dehydrogenase n=1 Tax=Acidocella aquatica TaxID=1922313 RepID=A0ABQ6A1E3_9PROT|nr:Gfo/Idh/MocA family oxidoreductase [Acidocella aquatica]GLR65989.1 inositol 2-dehydrogenase [Acidocella aquatica]
MTLQIGVIGTGAIGQDHIRRLTQTLSGAKVIAVNDIDAQRARGTIAKYELDAKLHEDPHSLIADAGVQAVLVTSWGPTHEAFVLAAIAQGKPVFCEKPLAETAAGCLRIADAEQASGRRLVQVGFMRQYDKGYRALREVIRNGGIGEPLMLHCAHRNPTVGESYTASMAITDTLIHELDVLRWLLDDDYISAQVVYPRRTRNAHAGLADPQIVLLETARGVRIDVEVFVNCQYGYDIQCAVIGETGTASLPEPSSVLLRSEARVSSRILTDWKERFIDAYDFELQAFVDGVKGRGLSGPTAWDGYAAAVAADSCLLAQKSGKVETIAMQKRPAFYAPD